MTELFVYGTLRHPPLIARLLGRAVGAVAATLPGHRVAPLAGRPYPGLVVDEGCVAAGDLITVDDRELSVLDAFEGDAYHRRLVRPMVDGDAVESETYLFREAEHVEPGTWSLADFVETHAARWVAGADPGTHHPDRSG